MLVIARSLACVLLVLANAYAQAAEDNITPPSEALSEIVVTANKREEKLQEVPISISVVSDKQLVDLGISSSQDIALITPGLTFGSQVLYGQPYIRGIGSSNTSLGSDSSVALYFDGVYQARQYSLVQNLNNIDQIEVLKGPQGTLYGRNATGGAISIVTKTPEPGFDANVEVTGGNYDLKNYKFYVTGGSDTLSASFAGYVRKHEGYYINEVTGDHVENEDDFGGMLKVLWKLNDRNSLLLSFDASNDEGDYGAFAGQFGGNNVTAALFPGACYTSQPWRTCADQEARNSTLNYQRNRGGSAHWVTNFDNFDLVVIGGLRGIVSGSAIDVDASSAPIIDFNIQGPRGVDIPGETYHMWSLEPYLVSKGNGPFTWLVGGLAYRDGGDLNVLIDALNQFGQQTADRSLGEAYAVYTEEGYRFGTDDKWKATAGARYSDEKKEIYDQSQFVYFGGQQTGTPTPATTFPNQQRSWNDVTGSASLSYNFSNGTAYGRWAQGFKSGAFNLDSPGTSPVNPEKITSYEVGAKSTVLDGRVDLSGAAFYYNYDNIQVQSITATGGSFLQNAASARIKGLEGSVRAKATDRLTVQAGLSLLQAKYRSYPNASVDVPCASLGIPAPENCAPGSAPATAIPAPNLSGDEMPQAPKITYNISLNYNLPVTYGRYEFAAVANHSGVYYFDPNDRLFQHAYTVGNASLTYHTLDEHWYVKAWSNNITNKAYLNYVSPVQFGDFGHYADPRTYGLTVGYRFK